MDTHFDVLILGTGLIHSIVAAALAKAGVKVAHVDTNAYYGGAEASLAQDELIQWCQARHDVSLSSTDPSPSANAYALSLSPALISSSGPLINALIQSGVARYTQFKLLDAIFMCHSLPVGPSTPNSANLAATGGPKSSNQLHRVPASKEDIFRTRHISVVSKRKLMRFLQFAASDFQLQPEEEIQPFGEYLRTKFAIDDDMMKNSVLYALAFCATDREHTLPALRRLRTFIQSAGRYGNSSFLIGHYGGLGEIAQGFCRTCAVHGGIYILGRRILSLTFPNETSPASILLEEIPDNLTADVVLCDASYIPVARPPNKQVKHVASAILILNAPVTFPPTESTNQTGFDTTRTVTIVIPPSPGSFERTIRLLHIGDETLSCPRGKFIVYAWSSFFDNEDKPVIDPESLLRPHISELIPLSSVDFSCYYIQLDYSELAPCISPHPRTFISPALPTLWSETGDKAASEATRLYAEIMRVQGRDALQEIWPSLENVEDEDDAIW